MWLFGKWVKNLLSSKALDPIVQLALDIIGPDCGCTEREESLNNFGLNFLEWFKPGKVRTREEERMRMALLNNPKFLDEIGALYQKYVKQKYTRTPCPSCNLGYIRKLYANPEFQKVMEELQIELKGDPQDKIKKAIVGLNKKKAIVKRKPRKRKTAKK